MVVIVVPLPLNSYWAALAAQHVIPPNLYFMNIIAWGPQVNSHMVPTQNAALSDLWYQCRPIKPDPAAKNNHTSLLLEY